MGEQGLFAPDLTSYNKLHQSQSPSAAQASRLHMMTHRLLQEKVLENVIKQRLLEKARLRSQPGIAVPDNDDEN